MDKHCLISKSGQLATMRAFLGYKIADVAQLVEQLTRNEQVVRSIRIIGSRFHQHFPNREPNNPERFASNGASG